MTQVGPALDEQNDFDRGHLVRRRDPGWGTPGVANDTTFCYSSLPSRAAVLNQLEQLWAGLEDYLLEHAATYVRHHAVFTGPSTPCNREVQIPLRFSTIAALLQDGNLAGAPATPGPNPAGANNSRRRDAMISESVDGRASIGSSMLERLYDVPMKDEATSLDQSSVLELRPPEHSRVCWAAALGGARHLIPLDGWTTAAELAVVRLLSGEEACICARRRGQQRGRRQQ